MSRPVPTALMAKKDSPPDSPPPPPPPRRRMSPTKTTALFCAFFRIPRIFLPLTNLGASLPSYLEAKLPSDESTTHTLLWVKEKPKQPAPSKPRENEKRC